MSTISTRQQVLAFDIYGTILDTNGIATALGSALNLDEDKAAQLSLLWRRYQLEYTYRLNSMRVYESFDTVTRNALLHALAENGIQASNKTVDKLMEAYNHLAPYDDAIPALQALSKVPYIKIVVFSNGTREMVTTALNAVSALEIPEALYLADDVRVYKPAMQIYQGLLAKLNADREEGAYTGDDVWLVSGNPFDVTGARNAGLQAFWVDRAGGGWVDRAVPLKPSQTIRSLSQIEHLLGGATRHE
ncbi:haloacid dehalogenase [Trametopsis cervina]|nr:haloacid dehalogenase [Trametopsis cervina]